MYSESPKVTSKLCVWLYNKRSFSFEFFPCICMVELAHCRFWYYMNTPNWSRVCMHNACIPFISFNKEKKILGISFKFCCGWCMWIHKDQWPTTKCFLYEIIWATLKHHVPFRLGDNACPFTPISTWMWNVNWLYNGYSSLMHVIYIPKVN